MNPVLLLATLVMIVSPVLCSAGETPDVSVEVFQALRDGVKGVSFENDPVRIGLPFPRGMVREVDGKPALAVAGREHQARTLKRWPDGSVKWGLVEFLASPAAGKSETVRVVTGAGVSAGAPLAREVEGRVIVDTGPMQVAVRKSGFAIFDRVVVDGQEVVRPGVSRGIVLTDGAGKEFLASACADTRVTVEENGPVAATVRIDGGHCSGRERMLDYTMRLFFAKGKSRVKAQYTLRNASRQSVRQAFITSLDLETALVLGAGGKAGVSTHRGIASLDLDKGDAAFYQAVSDFPWMSDGQNFYDFGPIAPDYSREKQRGYKQEGYWVRQNGEVVVEGKRGEFPDPGFVDVADSGGRGATVGIRHMGGQWPKALRADRSGRVTASLWPRENGQGYWIFYGSHTTYEVLYSFHAGTAKAPAEEMKRLQYPLAARGPIAWYNQNVEGIYPLYPVIGFSDEAKLARAIGADYGIGWRKPKFSVWRYHYWGHGAFLNQHDFARISLMNSIREDRDLVKAGETRLLAESMVNYYADWSVYHSDDYDYRREQPKPKENADKGGYAKMVFEWEHQHWYGMPLWYYMTGDERVREAILDWGEYVKKTANPLSLTYMRVFGSGMFSLAAMYEFTGDAEFLKLADMNLDRLLKVKYDPKQGPPPTIFIDWERGVVAGGSGSGWPGVKPDVMMGSILYDGILNYHNYSGDKNPLKGEARRLLTKMSEFMLREPYVEGTKRNHWAYWLPYIYNLQDKEKSDHSYRLIGQATFWTVFPYVQTGEERWLAQMKKMMRMALWDESGIWGSFGYLDHPGFQTMGYYLLSDAAGAPAGKGGAR